ncbi:rRNA 2'-O-methyltransferase fibrillarin [Drosophila tropicalis]|uniref:rRNA 2'-O-methyltransferase fibrillarin n=1 Tax=Drosophila tropicalis TaxID=46794 RepID=UPI0035ABBBD8
MGKRSLSKNKTKVRDGKKTTSSSKVTTGKASKSKSIKKGDKTENRNQLEPQKPEMACSLQQMIMVSIEPHRHSGIFLARSRDDAIMLLTRSLAPDNDDCSEQRFIADMLGKRNEYRSWSPFQSKLAAAILGGVSNIHIGRASKILLLDSGLGRTITHVADIVGESGTVYAVDNGERSEGLMALARKYSNIVPIIDDPTMPYKYRMIISGCVDMIFINTPQLDQVRTLMLNSRHYLKVGGHFAIVLQANASDSSTPTGETFAKKDEAP